MKRTAFRLLVAASLVLSSAASSEARTRARFGGTLRAEMRGQPAQWSSSPFQLLVFDTLTEVDDSGRVKPALAARWDSQNGGRRWHFWLRQGVRFHDGTTLSPATVVQSLTAGVCQGCPWRVVRVQGDSVLFEADNPLPELPVLLAGPAFAISRNDSSGDLVGTGSFRIASRGSGVVTLAANEDSWRGQPYVNTVEIRGGRSIRDQWQDIGIGRADIAEVPPELIRRAQQERLKVLVSRNVDLLAVVVNTALQGDSRFCEAVAASFEPSALFNVIFQKQGEVAGDLLPNWLSGYAFLFPSGQNLLHARELRAEIGLHPEISIVVDAGDEVLQLAADRLALNLKDAGFAARTVTDDSGGAHLRLQRVHLSTSSPGAALDELFASLRPPFALSETAPASTEDAAVLYQLERTILEHHTIIPILYLPRALAVSPRVRDLVPAPDGSLRSADFWLEDGR